MRLVPSGGVTRAAPTSLLALTALIVSIGVACGADDSEDATGAPVDQTVGIATVEYAFEADAAISITAGETSEFVVTNEGEIDHEMEVLTDASRRLGKTSRLAPGQSESLVVTVEEPGVYTVICDIDDHRSRGQQAEFTVAP